MNFKSLLSCFFFISLLLNGSAQAKIKSPDGSVTYVHYWKDKPGFIFDFNEINKNWNICKNAEALKFIVPNNHPHYKEITNLIITAAVSNLDVAVWLDDEFLYYGLLKVDDVVVVTKK